MSKEKNNAKTQKKRRTDLAGGNALEVIVLRVGVAEKTREGKRECRSAGSGG